MLSCLGRQYVGSKHVVEGITKSAAIEFVGTGVRVNIVGPHPTETRMFNRLAQTQQNKANFLEDTFRPSAWVPPKKLPMPSCSLAPTRASYIVGASLAVDGGMTAG